MATDVERLVVSMETNFRKYENAMKRIQVDTNRNMRKIEQRYEKAESRIAKFGDTFRATIAAVGVGYAVREMGQLADAFTEAGNKLAAAEVIYGGALATQSELADLAKETRTQFGATIDVYSRAARAAGKFGASQEELLRFTELLNKALTAGGATGSERYSAITQLSQGLQSGQLMGEELRAIRENAPLVAQAIADAMDVSIGELKELGAEGKITGDIVFRAVLDAANGIEAAFGATEKTVGESFENLRTEAIRFVGELDNTVEATEKLTKFIGFAADNIEVFKDAAVVAAAAVGGGFAAKAVLTAVGSLTALSASLGGASAGFTAYTAASLAAARATNALSASMKFFGGPWVVAIGAIAGAVALLALRSEDAEDAIARLDQTMARLGETNQRIEDDQERLKTLSDELAQSIEGQGEAAELTKRLEIDAINARIAKNQELAATYETLLRAQAEEARFAVERTRRQMEDRFADKTAGYYSRQFGAPNIQRLGAPDQLYTDVNAYVEATREAAIAAQEAGESLTAEQREVLAAVSDLAELELELESKLNQIEQLGQEVQPSTTPSTDTPDTETETKTTGPSPDEIARMREMLELENQLAVAEASGDKAAIDAAQRKIDLARLTADFEKAGYENAAARAEQQLALVDAAQAEADAEEQNLEAREKLLEMAREARRIVIDQLSYELELARLRGDETAIKKLERELQIQRDIVDALERGLTLTQAKADALGKAGERDDATETGDALRELENRREDFRSFFKDSFKDGFLASLDDNAGEALSNWWRTYTTRALSGVLDELADDIFNNLFPSDGNAGGVLGFIGSLFGGSRATGGHVRAGSIYKVNENTPNSEYFMPGVSGQIIPNLDQVVRAGGSTQIVQVDMSGSLVTRDAVESLQSGLQALGYEVQRVDQSVEPRATRAVKVKSARGPVGRW